jgi:hypothetical protein
MKRSPMKRTNPKRKAAEFERCYHSEARVLWVQALPSVVSGKGPCQNAHTKGDGAGRKAGYQWIVPLTESEHEQLHKRGKASFEAAHQIDLDHEASLTDARYEQYVAAHQKESK